MAGIETTYRTIFFSWMLDATRAVWRRAVRNVSGGLTPKLKRNTGELANSIFSRVNHTGRIGDVGSNNFKMKIWELEGMKGPIKAAPGKAILIRKRGTGFGRGAHGIRLRKATWTKEKFRPPVEPLKKALIEEMTGSKGKRKYRNLAARLGLAIGTRYVRMIARKYGPNVRVSMGGRIPAFRVGRMLSLGD